MDRTQSMINALQKAEPDEFNQIRMTVDARDLLVEMLKEQQEQIERLEHDLAITEDNLRHYLNGNE